MPRDYIIAGTPVIKVPSKMLFISPKSEKISANKTLTKTGQPSKNCIRFEADDEISEITIINPGKMASNSTKFKRELGAKLEAEVLKYQEMGKTVVKQKKQADERLDAEVKKYEEMAKKSLAKK